MVESKSFPGLTKRDGFVTYPMAALHLNVDQPILEYRNSTTFRNVRYHYVKLGNPMGHLHVLTAGDQGCPGVMKTSDSARLAGCKVATNAGFFNMQTGDCIGNVISRGHLEQSSGLRNVNFGILKSGHFLVGYLTKEKVKELEFQELVAGVIWLVAEGRAFWDSSETIEGPDFMDILAPRTMIGHDRMGRIILVVVEGTEKVSLVEEEGSSHDGKNNNKNNNDDEQHHIIASGVTIPELGQLAIQLGLYNAINLDGGGSSAFFMDGKVMNQITEPCIADKSQFCERLVTTIICIK